MSAELQQGAPVRVVHNNRWVDGVVMSTDDQHLWDEVYKQMSTRSSDEDDDNDTKVAGCGLSAGSLRLSYFVIYVLRDYLHLHPVRIPCRLRRPNSLISIFPRRQSHLHHLLLAFQTAGATLPSVAWRTGFRVQPIFYPS